MSALSLENIEHLSVLARLALRSEEQSRFAEQLSDVMQYVEQLTAVPVPDSGPLKGVTGLSNVLADDAPRAENDPLTLPSEKILAGAPAREEHFFLVRAVLDVAEES